MPPFAGPPQLSWTPRSYDYYARQVGSPPRGGNQRGAWQRSGVRVPGGTFAGPEFAGGPMHGPAFRGLSGADAETRLDSLIATIVHDFHEHGTGPGMREAIKYGLQDGARLWIETRSESEEELSGRLAKIRAYLSTHPGDEHAMVDRAFLQVRLREVRAAIKDGATPPQAVADRADIPRREVKPWIAKAALVVGIIALVRSLGR